MQLLRSSKKYIDQNKDGETVPRLESVEVVLAHCNLANNNYQQASKVLFTFVRNNQLLQLITITRHSLTMLKTTNAEFSFIEIWFTDQNDRPLEIEYNVNITVIKMRYSLEPNYRKYVHGYGFLSFVKIFGDKYGKKLMDSAPKTGLDAAKTASKKSSSKNCRSYWRFNRE